MAERSQTHNRSSSQPNESSANFDQWAQAVKRQMIAALKRRGSESE